jgi:outer membrane protein assembly factor BamB
LGHGILGEFRYDPEQRMPSLRLSSLCGIAHRGAVVAVVTLIGLASVATLHAQAVVIATADEPAAATPHQGFTILKADSKLVESIEDFDRYAGKKSWELAFRALNAIDEANSRGMVPAQDGFMVPIRARVKQSLLRLPPEGREAYRLFNDANAKQLWEHLQGPPGTAVNDELPTLRKLVDRYFLSSVGDLAADRLGDALFEQGNFAAAENLWRSIIEKYPDSHLSPVRLQVKRCVALARLGRAEALAALVAQVVEQYGDQKLTIGGETVVAADFVRSLATKESSSRPASAKPDEDSILLPAADEPVWQIRITGPNMAGQVDPNTGMPMGNTFHAAPSAAVLGNRLYANWLGTVYAADLETGKMLWRTGKFTDNAQPAINCLQQGMTAESFSLVASGGKLFVLRPPTKNLLGELLGSDAPQDVTVAFECLDATNGKTLWRAPKMNMYIESAPFLLDRTAYLLGVSTNNAMMNLVAIDVDNGHLRWKLDLGTPQANNGRGQYDYGGPRILSAGGMLYIATNNGALLAVNPASRRIEWALEHDTRPPNNQNQRFWMNGIMVSTAVEGPPTLLESDGVFYLKDGAARLLYALDPAAPGVNWKRPFTAEESVAAIDGNIAYLVGHELSALDLKSRTLLWSAKLPAQTNTPVPLICADHVYVPTSRGIFDLDPANGDIRRVFRGADRESSGGKLLVAGDKLIYVSDTAVTAYPIQRAKPTKTTSQARQ